MVGDITELDTAEAKARAIIAPDYVVDEVGLLYFCPRTVANPSDRAELVRLVVPELLQDDVLHHYHASLEGGHQGVGRTYHRVRLHFHWRGLFRSVQQYVGKCVDCETRKGCPILRGESPGNVQATYPFQIIAMNPNSPKATVRYSP